jgi:oligopeptide/dipeptide ABC transporter ATP-binding protein
MPPGDPLLSVSHLSKSFPARRDVFDVLQRRRPMLQALDDISLVLGANQTMGIVGESGSGKSTLAKCLVRLHEPDAGEISFSSTDVRAARGKDFAALRREMQLIYQDPYSSLNPLMTVERAVGEPAVVHGLTPNGQSAKRYAGELLELVGLSSDVATRRPNQLSGGQRQRVAIARAMAVRPQLLIADEPVSALDVSVQAQVLDLFQRIRVEQGVSMIIIAHQLSVVAQVAQTVAVMYLGRIVESGPMASVFNEPSHPYTVALLKAQPGRHRRGRRRKPALEGEIPSPLSIPSGCRFRTRCPLAQEICEQVDPAPVDVGADHRSWCHFASDVRARRNEP